MHSLSNEELHIEVVPRSSNGQLVDNQPRGVLVTHLPTGIGIFYAAANTSTKNLREAKRLLAKVLDNT